MGRRRASDWDLEPVVACLHDVAHAPGGIRDQDLLAKQTALLEHPAVLLGWRDRPRNPRRAILKVLDDMRALGGRLDLSAADLAAVRVLLWAQPSVVIGRQGEQLDERHGRRAVLAGRLIGRSKFRDRDHKPGEPVSSPESRLLQRFAAALDDFEAPRSVTEHLGWTEPLPPIPLVGARVDDLVGGWGGVTVSDWHIKAATRTARSGAFACAMSIDVDSGGLAIVWHYPAGRAVAVSARVTADGDGRRMHVTYESTAAHDLDPSRPSHRGAAVLRIDGDPATRIEGPYWTDRGTSGILRFGGTRSAAAPTSWLESVALLGLPDHA